MTLWLRGAWCIDNLREIESTLRELSADKRTVTVRQVAAERLERNPERRIVDDHRIVGSKRRLHRIVVGSQHPERLRRRARL